jgi:hypothetical protein
MIEKIQNFYWSIVPHHLRPGQLWYRFKCWIWHRYSTVKPRGLPHTWVDRSHLMPHMIFEILSNFIEKECGENCFVEWYGDDPHMIEVSGHQVNVRDEMQDLYDWWHKDYIVNIDNIHDEWHAHRELHVKDVFNPVEDKETLEWVESVDGSDEAFDGLVSWDHEYSSPEAEIENERLFAEARAKETAYLEGLNSRLHRVINIIPYMWT